MILAADIGNTNVVFGCYISPGQWTEVWRMDTKDEAQEKLPHLLRKKFKDPQQVKHIIISSVVPFFTAIIAKQLQHKFGIEPFIIGSDSYTPLPIAVLRPEEIGSDLVANATAAYHKFKSDCLVIDFGTALSFTAVFDRSIKGVSIAPGLRTAMKALAGNAVKLSEIPLKLPASVLGKDTTTAIQSGILWGYVGLVEKMITRIEAELGVKLKTVATGGLSKILDPLHQQFDAVEPHLTLEGMRLIYEANLNVKKNQVSRKDPNT